MQSSDSVGSTKLLKISMNVRADTATSLRAIKLKNTIFKIFKKWKKADSDEGNGVTITLHSILKSESLSERTIVKIVEACLYNGRIHLNIKNKSEETELHIAVGLRMKLVVDALIRRGSNVDVNDEKGNSIAHFFIEDERRKFEIAMGSCRDSVPWRGDDVENESANYVEWLITKGFDFDRRNKEGKSALHLSIEYNLQHISLALLKHTRNVHSFDPRHQTLLHLFFECNAKHRRKHRCSATLGNNWFSFNLRYATRIVKTLLDKGCHAVALDYEPRSALRTAIEGGEDIAVVEMLINHALKSHRDLATTRVLLELSKSCGSWADSKLEYFSHVSRVLMVKGADVNVQDEHGMTPLHHAFLGQNRRLVDLLSEHRADFGLTTSDGDNLFHALAKVDRDSEALFDIIATKGSCDAHGTNDFHETPLHLACRHENLAIARKLIEHGVDVNVANRAGQTPLHLAASYNREGGVVELLLDSGAHVDAKDIEGSRPLHYANSPLVPLLLRRGAHVDTGTFASRLQRDDLVDLVQMVAHGADVNALIDSLPESRLRKLTLGMAFLTSHWMKLRAAGLPRSRGLEGIAGVCRQFHRECLEEIEALKSTIIDGRGGTSIYDFLHMDFSRRRVHVNGNGRLRIIVEFPCLNEQFPKYKPLILASYRETVAWKSLLEPAKRAWCELTNFSWPDLCSEAIFAYLGNEDLMNVIEHEDRHAMPRIYMICCDETHHEVSI